MGNNVDLKNNSSNYTELRAEQNQLLSNIVLVQEKITKEKFIVKQLNYGNEFEYQRMLKQFKQRKALSEKKAGKSIIRLKSFIPSELTSLCGKTFKITLYLQSIKSNLHSLLLQKLLTCTPYLQQQLLHFIKCLTSTLLTLHDNNYKNIHINKQSILLMGDGNYKLMDMMFCGKVHPYYEILNGVPVRSGTYLAPELLEEIRNENQDFYNTPKADIFTLGVIMLQMCKMSNYDLYYNYTTKTINIQALHTTIQQIPYSSTIKSILHGMLASQQQDRLGLISLKQMLTGVNQQLHSQSYTHQAYSDIHQQPLLKHTARTYITRTKPQSAYRQNIKLVDGNNSSGIQYNNTQTQCKVNRAVSEYAGYKDTAQDEGMRHVDYRHREQGHNFIRGSYANDRKSIYGPISYNAVSQEQRHLPIPYHNIMKKNTTTLQINPTQLSSPVNHFAQSLSNSGLTTPIHKIQILNSARLDLKCQLLSNSKSYGKHTFSNGAFYEGEMNNHGEFDGNGMLYYPNGKLCYSGSWKNNSFHGFGVLHNESNARTNQPTNFQNFNMNSATNWSHYQGQFNLDKKEGFATLFMHNGDKFSGCFRNDSIQGFGTFYFAINGKNINGIWVENVLRK